MPSASCAKDSVYPRYLLQLVTSKKVFITNGLKLPFHHLSNYVQILSHGSNLVFTDHHLEHYYPSNFCQRKHRSFRHRLQRTLFLHYQLNILMLSLLVCLLNKLFNNVSLGSVDLKSPFLSSSISRMPHFLLHLVVLPLKLRKVILCDLLIRIQVVDMMDGVLSPTSAEFIFTGIHLQSPHVIVSDIVIHQSSIVFENLNSFITPVTRLATLHHKTLCVSTLLFSSTTFSTAFQFQVSFQVFQHAYRSPVDLLHHFC